MKFKIDPKIFEKFPGLNIGVVIVRGADNAGEDAEISEMLREQEKRIKNSYESETLSQEPKINCWRKTYSSFGVKPKEAKSSVENLYKMVTRGIEIRKINKLVDIYNLICLKFMVPVGGEDLDKMVGDLELAIAGADEKAAKILGSDQDEKPSEGEVFYKDDESVVCRRWNWREADRTKLTEQTKNAVLVIDAVEPVTRNEVEQATKNLAELVKKYCGGETKSLIINQESNDVEI